MFSSSQCFSLEVQCHPNYWSFARCFCLFTFKSFQDLFFLQCTEISQSWLWSRICGLFFILLCWTSIDFLIWTYVFLFKEFRKYISLMIFSYLFSLVFQEVIENYLNIIPHGLMLFIFPFLSILLSKIISLKYLQTLLWSFNLSYPFNA